VGQPYVIEAHAFATHDPRMIDGSSWPAVDGGPQRVSGAWVFRGTRVPVAALFQILQDGPQLSDFLE
jgi:uncharacterized protein (DUF433 family)